MRGPRPGWNKSITYASAVINHSGTASTRQIAADPAIAE